MLKFRHLPPGAWVRTCSECNHSQVSAKPSTTSDRWRQLTCKKCGSQAMDYGCTNDEHVEDVLDEGDEE